VSAKVYYGNIVRFIHELGPDEEITGRSITSTRTALANGTNKIIQPGTLWERISEGKHE
jgi:hypothetical protein